MFRVLTFIASFIIIVNTAYAASFYDEMHDAIVKNDIRTVESLLKKTNADPNERRDTRASPTFLTQAARLGREEIVSLLIASGADVNSGDGDSMTPLMHAAWKGHVRIVEILIKAGADIQDENKWGETALQLAKQGKHDAVITVLEKAGAKK
ncbi:MAG: hypothetical protein A2Z08_03255 [Deltaproteobacteria bacterium RBG_16_54_11]|nr:MAG: hypothetical protein A2Z08_03255 [Deltaproteobacteria bacterium RBG_16_54_11]